MAVLPGWGSHESVQPFCGLAPCRSRMHARWPSQCVCLSIPWRALLASMHRVNTPKGPLRTAGACRDRNRDWQRARRRGSDQVCAVRCSLPRRPARLQRALHHVRTRAGVRAVLPPPPWPLHRSTLVHTLVTSRQACIQVHAHMAQPQPGALWPVPALCVLLRGGGRISMTPSPRRRAALTRWTTCYRGHTLCSTPAHAHRPPRSLPRRRAGPPVGYNRKGARHNSTVPSALAL